MFFRLFKRSAVLFLVLPFLGLDAMAPPTSAADDAAALLAKHKAFVGWEFGDGTFKTIRVETVATQTGKDGKPEELSRTVDLQRGVVNHLTAISGTTGSSSDSGFTGTVYWLSNANGFTIPRLDDDRKTTVALKILFGEGSTAMPATTVRNENVNGVATVVIREKIPNAVSLDLYVDPNTGAYKRAVVDADGIPTQVEIDKYGEIAPGKRGITAYHYAGSKSRRTRTYTPNAAISDDELHPPAPSAAWTFGSGKPFYVDVRERRILVDVDVNGVRGRFILDTGASVIVLTGSFAAKAKVRELRGSVPAMGITGEITQRLGRVDAIAFDDGSKLQNVVVTTGLNLGAEQVDGLLGFDFLAGAVVELDLDANRMTLYDPKQVSPDPTGGVVVIPDLSTYTPVLPMRLNGTVPIHGRLDSGNPLWVLLNKAVRNKTRTMIDRGTLFNFIHPKISGVSGRAEEMECGQLGSIDIGALSYKGAPVCFLLSQPEDEALLGLDFLKNFNLIFDYPEDKIVMFARKKYQ